MINDESDRHLLPLPYLRKKPSIEKIDVSIKSFLK